MATLVIENWNSYCSACGRSTGWDQEGHIVNLGYDKNINGTPGCGATWENVSMPYMLDSARFRNREYLHFPSWIYDLPLIGALFE